MSLFKARDWWSTVLGEKEEFDQGCLCLADVDNSGNGQGKQRKTRHLGVKLDRDELKRRPFYPGVIIMYADFLTQVYKIL